MCTCPTESGENAGSLELHPIAHVQHRCVLLQVSEPDLRSGGSEVACPQALGRAAPLAQPLRPRLLHNYIRLTDFQGTVSSRVWRAHSRLPS